MIEINEKALELNVDEVERVVGGEGVTAGQVTVATWLAARAAAEGAATLGCAVLSRWF